jgi:hypothetical protein
MPDHRLMSVRKESALNDSGSKLMRLLPGPQMNEEK